MEKLKSSNIADRIYKMKPLWKMVWQFHKVLNIVASDPKIALLGKYSQEIKVYVHTKSCGWMFIAELQ